MDAGNFPTFEKIINTTPLPRTRQANGVFLLEISFSPSERTHSLSVPMHLEFGAFGDVCRVTIEGWNERHSTTALALLKEALAQLQPAGSLNVVPAENRLILTFLENPSARQKRVSGTLVFNPDGALTALLAPLR
jgi:hypothetical protein